jgi:MoaA/NifB/PqqE/SkfB family radical SAM enzyme
MEYDIEADWILLYTCNFRCSYCGHSPELLGAKIETFGTPLQWVEGFKATGKTWLLHITGGEPSIYPGFVALCEQLAQDHYLSINSNLSHPCITAFAQRINPERVHFINAAMHYEWRKKRGLLDVFIKRVHTLQLAKFNVLLNIIMTPHVVINFNKISEYLESHGLFAVPKVIRGTHDGKHYPTSYSFKDKRLIYEYILQARQKYKSVIINMGEPPSINMFQDDLFLDGVKDYRGILCSAGSKFVVIFPNGTVTRCNTPEMLGNILFRNVSLLKAPKLCDTAYCPYFCEKYSIPYERLTLNNRNKRGTFNYYDVICTDYIKEFVKKRVSKLKKIFFYPKCIRLAGICRLTIP